MTAQTIGPDGPRKWTRKATYGFAVAAATLGLAACGSSDDSDGGASTAGTAAKAEGFPTVTPEPGTDIPRVQVKLGMRPYADNSFQYLAVKNGLYADNGIDITPKPYGIKNNDQAIAQMLNGTVEMQAMYAPSLIPTYKTERSLKQVMFTDYFNGWALLAPPDSGAKPVSELMKGGMPFKEAMAAALKPMEGKTLVVSQLLDNREFVNQAFTVAGLKAPKLQILDDAKSIVAARASKIDFAGPTGAPTTLQFEREGWIPLVTPYDIIDNADAAGTDVSALAGTVGLAANEKWIAENPNTVLRFVSATYRLIDEIKKDPAVLGDYATYLNSITGLSLTGKDLEALFEKYNPLTDFEFGTTYCQDRSKLLHFEKAYTGIIKAYEKQGAVEPGSVKPADVIWVCGVWNQLEDFRKKTEELLAGAEDLTGEQAELAKQAETLADQRNYLDAFRMATAAVAAS